MITLRSTPCLTLAFALLLSLPAGAAGPMPIAPPLSGPTPHVSAASVAFGAEGGVATWASIDTAHAATVVWGVPLDAMGQPQPPARAIASLKGFVNKSWICHADGAFRLWSWDDSWRRLRVARLDSELGATEVVEMPQRTPLPTACGSELAVAFDQREPLEVLFIDFDTGETHAVPLSLPGRVLVRRAVALEHGFGVVMATTRGAFFAQFSPEGELEGSPFLVDRDFPGTLPFPIDPILASDGSSTAVFYMVGDALNAVFVGRDGSIERAPDLRFGVAELIAAASIDGTYTVFLSPQVGNADQRTIRAVRIDRSGSWSASPETILEAPPRVEIAAIASSADRHHLYFFPQPTEPHHAPVLHQISVPASGSFERPEPTNLGRRISEAVAWQIHPASAGGDLGWMAAWIEKTADEEYLRIAASGPGAHTVAEPLTRRLAAPMTSRPDVEFDGLDFLVAWVEGDLLQLWRIRPSGAPVSPVPVTLVSGVSGYGSTPPRIMSFAARNGIAYFAWERSAHPAREIWGAIASNSAFMTPPIRLSPAARVESPYSYGGPVVSASDENFLVSWSERTRPGVCPGLCPYESTAQGRIVSRSGAALEPQFEWDEGDPFSAAGIADRHLVVFVRGAFALVRSSGATPALHLPFETFRPDVLTGDGEFLVGYWSPANLYLFPLVSHVTLEGEVVRTRGFPALDFPSAIDGRRALLSVVSSFHHEAPWYGAPTILLEETPPLTPGPPPPRRRGVRR